MTPSIDKTVTRLIQGTPPSMKGHRSNSVMLSEVDITDTSMALMRAAAWEYHVDQETERKVRYTKRLAYRLWMGGLDLRHQDGWDRARRFVQTYDHIEFDTLDTLQDSTLIEDQLDEVA